MKRHLGTIGIYLAGAIWLAVCILGGAAKQDQDPAPKSTLVLQEDDPGWDCHTMGNRICGPGHG